jgi:uncharacterized membrane protein YbhN (UPF0104 family)
MDGFGDAISALGDRLGDTRPLPLVIALSLHTISLAVRARVWRNILRSAFPGRAISTSGAFWAYVAGVGANAIAPIRGGDIVRIHAARRLIPGASIATIVSTLVAEMVFGLFVVIALGVWAVSSGGLPPLVQLHDAKAFEFSFYADHARLVLVATLALAVVGVVALRAAEHRVRALSRHVAAGFRVLRTPTMFIRVVALPQSADWVLRAATAYAMLTAFHVQASVHTALLVLVVDSVATAIPFTPGGGGAQQALLAFALGGSASQGQILAFSVGQQAAITFANIILGILALLKIFGHMRTRRLGPVGPDAV